MKTNFLLSEGGPWFEYASLNVEEVPAVGDEVVLGPDRVFNVIKVRRVYYANGRALKNRYVEVYLK